MYITTIKINKKCLIHTMNFIVFKKKDVGPPCTVFLIGF